MLHPAITLLAIVATANHYWLDAAVAGVLVVAAAALLSSRRDRQLAAALPDIAIPNRSWTPAIPNSWANSIASNDPRLEDLSSDDWFAELEAGRLDSGGFETGHLVSGDPVAGDERILVDHAT